MVIHVVRALFLLVVLAFTVSYSLQAEVYEQGTLYVTLYILIPSLSAFGVIMLDMFWRKKHLQALSGLFFGLVAGLVIAYVVIQIVDLVGDVFTDPVTIADRSVPAQQGRGGPSEGTEEPPPGDNATGRVAPAGSNNNAPDALAEPRQPRRRPVLELIKVLLGTAAVFLCVSFVLQTKDDFRFVIPYVEFSKQSKGARPILLDTSVIIDGRVADISTTGILDSEVIVPRFVLEELQTIADSSDKLKRNRGRRGLDILNKLQSSPELDIRIYDAHAREVVDASDVDAKLVALAELMNGRVVTNDYNLGKISKLRGVDVININDLANALKPVFLPGEKMSVKVIKPGEEAGQGVGYLDDGTMVVVNQGRDHIGRQIGITVTSALQTSAGRMIFGQVDAEGTFGHKPRQG